VDRPSERLERLFDASRDTGTMAGGMSRRCDQGTLADRSKARPERMPPARCATSGSPTPPIDPASNAPALLVMWRRTHSGASWEALVLYGAELRPGE